MYPQTTGSNVSATGALINGANPGTANNPNFTAQVTIQETQHDEMEIVTHPIEQGAPITDHSFKKPAECILHVGWSGGQTDVDSASSQPAAFSTALISIYQQLLTAQYNRVLYTVVTGKRTYTNMLIKGLSTVTDKTTEWVLDITIHLQQVLLVNTQDVTVNASPAAQASPQDTNPATNNGTSYVQGAAAFNYPAYNAVQPPDLQILQGTINPNLATPYTLPLINTQQQLQIALGQTVYSLNVWWNSNPSSNCWMIDIADVNQKPIIGSIPMVTGVDLLGQYGYLNFGGELIVQSSFEADLIPTYENLGNGGYLYFVVS